MSANWDSGKALTLAAVFLRGTLPLRRLQHGQQLGGLGTVGGRVVSGHTGALDEERGAVQGGVCGFYGKTPPCKSVPPLL